MNELEAINNLKACNSLVHNLKANPEYPYTEEVKDILKGFQKVIKYYRNQAHLNKLLKEADVTHSEILSVIKNYVLRDLPYF